jgi:3-deoxy-D-manno-octulosonic acid kinase
MSAGRNPGAEFVGLRIGRKTVYIRRELAPDARAILARLDELGRMRTGGAGNRASGFPLKIEGGPDLFVRRMRRGGLIRLLVSDLYIGFLPRPLRELAVGAEAMRRDLPLAEPMGAIVERVAPGIYRGIVVTRAMTGMTLWEFIRTDDDPAVRNHVMLLARRVIDAMHQAGLFHADLNLGNLFVRTDGDSLSVAILDLDKARLLNHPLSPAMRRRNLRRLLRSIQKLDPKGRYFDENARAILTGG